MLFRSPRKPISEGYKLWVLGSFEGYYFDWLIHSNVDGPEAYSRKKKVRFTCGKDIQSVALSETFQVPIVLGQRLRMISPH